MGKQAETRSSAETLWVQERLSCVARICLKLETFGKLHPTRSQKVPLSGLFFFFQFDTKDFQLGVLGGKIIAGHLGSHWPKSWIRACAVNTHCRQRKWTFLIPSYHLMLLGCSDFSVNQMQSDLPGISSLVLILLPVPGAVLSVGWSLGFSRGFERAVMVAVQTHQQ